MSRNDHLAARIDWSTLFIYAILCAIGFVAINTTSHAAGSPEFFNYSGKQFRQLIWFGVSIVLIIIVLRGNSMIWEILSPHIYMVMLFLMLITAFFGKEINGSKSWIGIGGINIQTAEFMKLATALFVARYIALKQLNFTKLSDVFSSLIIILLPIIGTLIQHDLGSGIVFGSFILLFYRLGLPIYIVIMLLFLLLLFFGVILFENYYVILTVSSVGIIIFGHTVKNTVLTIVLLGYNIFLFLVCRALVLHHDIDIDIDQLSTFPTLLLFPLGFIYSFRKKKIQAYVRLYFSVILIFITSLSVDFLYDNVLKPHHRNRIEVYLGLKEDIRGSGFNLHQSKIAIAAGGFLGKGYKEGTQTQFEFVPEQSTDFIVTSIAEEFGFVGIFVLLTFYALLFYRIILISERQTNPFAKYFGYGVLGFFIFHTTLNMAMTLGLFPTIGIPLPLISYGGSSLLTFTLMLAILLKFDTERKVNF